MSIQPQERVVLTVTCTDLAQCEVAFEPEGSVHVLRPDDAFEVEVAGPGSGHLEITCVPGGVVIGAWSGAETRVRDRAGREVPT